MEFSRPFRALTPTLDGPVLTVLSRSAKPMTRRQVTDLVEDASEAGVRKVLNRLATQGLVIEERIGAHYTYIANREHIMWPAVEIIVNASNQLDDKIRERVSGWEIQPFSVELFGSVATGSTTAESDIDLMIYRPNVDADLADEWDEQVDDLRLAVERWTGNECNVLQIDPPELVKMAAENEPMLAAPSIPLVGVRVGSVFPSAEMAKAFAALIDGDKFAKTTWAKASAQHGLVTPALSSTVENLLTHHAKNAGMKNLSEVVNASAKLGIPVNVSPVTSRRVPSHKDDGGK